MHARQSTFNNLTLYPICTIYTLLKLKVFTFEILFHSIIFFLFYLIICTLPSLLQLFHTQFTPHQLPCLLQETNLHSVRAVVNTLVCEALYKSDFFTHYLCTSPHIYTQTYTITQKNTFTHTTYCTPHTTYTHTHMHTHTQSHTHTHTHTHAHTHSHIHTAHFSWKGCSGIPENNNSF